MDNPTKYCTSCGNPVLAEAEICVKCGVRQQSSTKKATTDKSRIAYALFYMFLWPIGLHDFYAGKTGKAVAWLVGSIVAALTSVIGVGVIALSIMSIVAFVMGIVWLTRSDAEFAAHVNA